MKNGVASISLIIVFASCSIGFVNAQYTSDRGLIASVLNYTADSNTVCDPGMSKSSYLDEQDGQWKYVCENTAYTHPSGGVNWLQVCRNFSLNMT